MLKLKSITIEGMHNVDKKTYEFDNLNYLFGQNGAGKSTVLQAIQLAILGYIPGTNKTKEAIFSHSNNHTMAVTAKLTGDNDVTIQRIWTKSGKGITSSVSSTPEVFDIENMIKDVELPIFNFNEFVNMTANKLKEWFISFAPSGSSEIDWKSILTKDIDKLSETDSTLLADTLSEVNSYEETGIEACKKLNTYLKSMLSVKKSELQRNENTIQSLIYYDDCDESADIDDLKLQIMKLQADKSQYIKHSTIQANNSATLEMLNEIKPHIQSDCYENDSRVLEANSKLSQLKEKTDEVNSKIESIHKEIFELQANINNNKPIIDGNGICVYTNQICESILSSLGDIKKKSEDAQDKINKLQIEELSLKNEKDIMLKESDILKRDISDIKSKYDKYNTLKSSIVHITPVNPDPIDYDSEIENLYSTISKIEANQKYNQLIDFLTNEKYKIELEIQVIKKWASITDANGLQTELSEKPFEIVSNELDKYLRYFFKDSKCMFNLTTKANSFSFGLSRNNCYVPFDLLSSGEKCLYTIALMMYIVDHTNSDIKCIIIDDLLDHLDNSNIDKLFESLSNNDIKIQFIFAGVKSVSDKASGCVINI